MSFKIKYTLFALLMTASSCSNLLEKDSSTTSETGTDQPIQVAMVNYKDAPIYIASALDVSLAPSSNSALATAAQATLLNMPAVGDAAELNEANTFSYIKTVIAGCTALQAVTGTDHFIKGKITLGNGSLSTSAVNAPEWNGYIEKIAKAAWGRKGSTEEIQILQDLKKGLETDSTNSARVVFLGICEAAFLSAASYLK